MPTLAEGADTDTYFEQSGAVDIWDDLTDETKDLYRNIGIDSLSDLSAKTLSYNALWSLTADTLVEQSRTPLLVSGISLAAVVLCAYLGGMRDTVTGNGIQSVYNGVSVLAVSSALLLPFTACIRSVQYALSGATVFMGSFSPVYMALLTVNGGLKTAASYQTTLLLFSQLLTALANGVLLPIMLTALALGVVSAASDTANFSKMGEMLLRGVSWTLGIVAGVFTTLLSVNTTLGSAVDTLGNKMLKVSLTGLVPVVGGALSEALLTVRSCIGVVKNTVGAFGIITVALLILPPLLQCVCWFTCFWVSKTAAEVFDIAPLAKLLQTTLTVTKTMIAILLTTALFMVIATTLVMLAGRGGG